MSTDSKTSKPCCKDGVEGKLVKATELPIYGNPYPPKDVIVDETPNALQLQISSIRESLTPYTAPLVSAIQRTSYVFSVGSSHLQTTLQGLVETQNSIRNAAIISSMALLGVGLARRRGFFKKVLYGSTLATGTTAVLYPSEAGEKSQMLWYIARNKLPVFASQQYRKYFNGDKVVDEVAETNEVEK